MRPEDEPGVRFTPPELARRLARIVRDGTRGVLDPACGDGELLIAAWETGRGRGLRAEQIHGIERDAARAATARRRLAHATGRADVATIVVADALDPRTPWPADADVIANPPWVSFSGRQSATRDARVSAAASTAARSGWPSLHGAFLERIAEHVAQHAARAAVLVPAATCELDGYGAVRRAVTALARLTSAPLELGESAFPGVVEPAALIELEPWRPADAADRRGSRESWLRAAPDDAMRLAALDDHPRLDPACFGDIGVHTGNSARQLLASTNAGDPFVREGRDLEAFRIGPPRLRLNVALERTSERRFRYGDFARYERTPVLVRQTADRPIAALHTAPTYFRNTLLACWPPAELDPAFVVAVLNSTIAASWHRLRFLDARQRTFPQVKVAHLRALPFPFVRRSSDAERHDRIASLVRGFGAERSGEDARRRARIDREVELAYGLDAAATRLLRDRDPREARS